uniref:Uncharacterized protein n=1 Tax=Lotus japonicus TaxID=34305 RepID=I3SLX1_LOTJA|nr:unknown [Lotus japonicus]
MPLCLDNHNRVFLLRQALQKDLSSFQFILNFRTWNVTITHHSFPPFAPLNKHLSCFIRIHTSSNQEPHQCRVPITLCRRTKLLNRLSQRGKCKICSFIHLGQEN